MSFSPFFPENKEDKEKSEQAWTFLTFLFPVTAPHAECLWLSLLFCPLTLQKLHLASIFIWLCTKYIPYLLFTLKTLFPLYLCIRKYATESPNARLNWRQSPTIFETMQKEEIKILFPLLLITDSWLWALAFYKPLDSSCRPGYSSRGISLLFFSSLPAKNKSQLSISSKPGLRIFHSVSVGKKAKILAGNSRHSPKVVNLCWAGPTWNSTWSWPNL